MRKLVYNHEGTRLLREEEAEPKCGRDFCDDCGDCLHCYGETPCLGDGEHMWVEYEGEKDE